jgi:hypothetical protein
MLLRGGGADFETGVRKKVITIEQENEHDDTASRHICCFFRFREASNQSIAGPMVVQSGNPLAWLSHREYGTIDCAEKRLIILGRCSSPLAWFESSMLPQSNY